MMTKKTLLPLFLLFTLSIAAYTFLGDRFGTAAVAGTDKTDTLFEEMGIFMIPDETEPVDFELMSTEGKKIRLSDYRGNIVFLNFWATWCMPCRIEMPDMEKLHTKMENRKFAMIAVSLKESAKDVKAYFKENKLTFTGVLDTDGSTAKAFRIVSIPTTYILGKKGGIIGVAMGPRAWDSDASIDLFKHLIAVD